MGAPDVHTRPREASCIRTQLCEWRPMALAFPSEGKLRPKASAIRCDTAMVLIPKTNLSSELQDKRWAVAVCIIICESTSPVSQLNKVHVASSASQMVAFARMRLLLWVCECVCGLACSRMCVVVWMQVFACAWVCVVRVWMWHNVFWTSFPSANKVWLSIVWIQKVCTNRLQIKRWDKQRLQVR